MASESVVNSHQPSLSEWLSAIGHASAEAFREEDMGKRDRLEILRQKIGIDYDRVTAFPARDFFSRTPDVQAFIAEHGNDLCALRLIPTAPGFPKLRTRGRSLKDSLSWLAEQNVDPAFYNVEFVEHSDEARWSTIFVVREDGIFGTVIDGLHHQLTQGNVVEGSRIRSFVRLPSGEWRWSEVDADVQAHMDEILEAIRVDDSALRGELGQELNSEFTSEGHLAGYFETLLWPTKLIFIDYNRQLHKMLTPPDLAPTAGHRLDVARDRRDPAYDAGRISPAQILVKGIPAAAGEATGSVRLVTEAEIDSVEFNPGDILVTDNTDVRFLPLMRRAGAIVTDRGGMLSHAAITARELGVPCVVGCRDATSRLSSGQLVRVDGGGGCVMAENSNDKHQITNKLQ